MHNICTYHVDVKGQVDDAVFNASSPIKVQAGRAESEATRLTIHADQSGLIGLLRHLHQQGFVLLSVFRAQQNKIQEEQDEDSNNNE